MESNPDSERIYDDLEFIPRSAGFTKVLLNWFQDGSGGAQSLQQSSTANGSKGGQKSVDNSSGGQRNHEPPKAVHQLSANKSPRREASPRSAPAKTLLQPTGFVTPKTVKQDGRRKSSDVSLLRVLNSAD